MEENGLKSKNEKNITIITAIVTAAVGVIAVIIGNLLGYMDKWWTAGFLVWIIVWTVVLIAGIILWLNRENCRKFVALLVLFLLSTIALIFVALWYNDKDEESTSGGISPTITIVPLPTAPLEPTLTSTVSPTPTATNTPTPEPTDTPAPTATNTPVPTLTNTPVPTATNTPVPTPTPHVHDYTWKVKTTKEANCTSEGKKEHICVCGDYWTETIPMREHSLVTDKAVAATCVETGKTEGSHCSICKYVKVEQKIIQMIDHKYNDESDAYCDYCNAYRATWHYYDQWNNSVYGDWELYNTETKESNRKETVTTYTYRGYYWYNSAGRTRYTSYALVPDGYELNKYLTEDDWSNYVGITTGGYNRITTTSNQKYNILQSEVLYSPVEETDSGWYVNGVQYWEEIIGSEETNVTFTEYHYFFRKFY